MITRLRIEMVARITFWLVTRVIPQRVGPFMRLFFKIPLFFQTIGLHFLIPRWILILETSGRRSGNPRRTPLEYGYNTVQKSYFLMSGWGGRSDWYRNARANPQVQLWLGSRRIPGLVSPASNTDVAEEMKNILKISPNAVKIWSAHSGVPYDGSHASLLKMAEAFPSLWVKID